MECNEDSTYCCFEGGRGEPPAKEAGNGNEAFSPGASRKKDSPANILILAP